MGLCLKTPMTALEHPAAVAVSPRAQFLLLITLVHATVRPFGMARALQVTRGLRLLASVTAAIASFSMHQHFPESRGSPGFEDN